ncbi:MAG TPA: Gfo/Idh/MocA family oxidoreductase [Sedimentisphaerales bacterium]|jgi:predicted dehydrogenase|nr:Gfo/Idh/MocA family oxidoreductase [Sedimentisphaerales bacterium]HNU29256.1 Gfo/Idh/MocA family oxidoreductase [Sedimentisphaerales bacterium]
MEDNKKIRTAVVGAGKMGAIHAKVYSQLPDSELVAVVDADKTKASQLAEKYGCAACTDCAEVFDKVDAVTIATPTTTHLKLAKLFLCRRIPVLVEKPLASSVREGRKIVSLARKYDTVVAVGHSERCNPVAQAMKRLDIEPKFIEAHRVSPYPFRSTDVGVVLDIMIHDIDIILSLARSKIKRVDAVGVTVIEGGEDICSARIVFDNGCVASITASRLALKTERRVRVFSRQAYLSVDYLKKSGILVKTDPNKNVVGMIKEWRQRSDFNPTTVNWPDLLHIEQLEIDDKEPIRLEQEAFLRAVKDREFAPEVSAEEGLAALRCAQKILRAIRKHKWD